MGGLLIKRGLIGKEDVLLGRETQTQQRNGGLKVITPINIINPVYSLSELQTLDPLKHDIALLVVKTALASSEPVNEFYAFDFLSEEDEQYPYVIRSSVHNVGRWILCTIGETRLRDEVIKQVKERTENIANVVLQRVQPLIIKAVAKEVQDQTAIFRKQGGVYFVGEDFSYNKNDFIQTFVEREGAIYSRLFMVKDVQPSLSPLTADPLSGEVYSRFGDVTIYKDNEFLKINDKFTEVYSTTKLVTPRYKVKPNTSYKLYTDRMNPSGKLKVKCFFNNSVSLYFEVIFCGMSYADFRFDNVLYSQTLKRYVSTSAYGKIFFPKFAITANSVYFGLSFESNEFCDSVEFDYTEMDLKPIFEETTFISRYCYAIRQGGGSYIPNLGQIISNVKQKQNSEYCSNDFYEFMLGALPYSDSITIDTELYHSYAGAKCIDDLPTIARAHLISCNTSTETLLGRLQLPALPNVKWKGRYLEGVRCMTDLRYVTYPVIKDLGGDRLLRDNTEKYFRNLQIDYDYNAGRDCSPLYKDNQTSIDTLSLWVNRLVIAY